MSNRADLWAISCFEPLENRMMLSTSYDLMSLMGYNHLGASWKYSSSISMIGPDGGDDSFSQTTKIAIGSKKAKYDNHLSAIVRTGNSQASLSTAWYTTSGGTYQSLSTMFAGIDGFTINLHDTCLAPKSMRIGQAFKDSGTFDGTLSFPSFDEDHPLTGSFNGTDSVATSLAKMQTIKTRFLLAAVNAPAMSQESG